ncbi:hypothetical protein T4B_5784 [Trichinella pseudospiralis]|uniref:Uncharacterized protein n=2 Tax=Trichinella pseudospiralis TaxID=6337 RepID=A0A0V1DTG1_TRIPS|nr:hypothetical protein T4A_3598 [Trichinella pseudospiralis]KRY64846.1 hypothetical protein T4A_11378 [Trichinella pseudospiralis]KRY70377.1 hypothetical protein T4A_11162 [Trichinella pseudospiralis]KRZ10110.1 hypothetical protein T4B_5784 [Trichinella pseudospiralis]
MREAEKKGKASAITNLSPNSDAAARYTSFTALPEKRMPWLEQIPHLLHLLETPPPRVFRKAKTCGKYQSMTRCILLQQVITGFRCPKYVRDFHDVQPVFYSALTSGCAS